MIKFTDLHNDSTDDLHLMQSWFMKTKLADGGMRER